MFGRVPCVLGFILTMTTASGQEPPESVTRPNLILVLFDIRNDPLEQRDLYNPSYPEFGPLKSALDGWLEQTSKRMRHHESIMAGRPKEEELRALGYLE